MSFEVLEKVAAAMAAPAPRNDSSIPAGFTYLGRFVAHDLTSDQTVAELGSQLEVEDLVQARTTPLELESLYGIGPTAQPSLYSDGVRFKLGATRGGFLRDDPITSRDLSGFDLPRKVAGTTRAERCAADIADPRNDDNLAVAQIHLAFLRFHNRVVDDLIARGQTDDIFESARAEVVKHYQALLRDDYLPRICEPRVLSDVFAHGRRLLGPLEHPTGELHARTGYMPVEFSVAAFRFGHSMVRASYEWNRIFQTDSIGGVATPERMFQFSGSGLFSPGANLVERHGMQGYEALPTDWIADWRRLFDFERDAGRADLSVPRAAFNLSHPIDTRLSPYLARLPPAAFGGLGASGIPHSLQAHIAFRNLTRARSLALATGQQMHALLRRLGVVDQEPLSSDEILRGKDDGTGADLSALGTTEREEFTRHTPLLFYIAREAETRNAGERLGPLGSRLVAETFHRCMEGSRYSIVRDRHWRPHRCDRRGLDGKFRMAHLLLDAFGDDEINRLG